MNQKEFEVMLGQTETRLKRLRVLYEHYFQGLERVEPLVQKNEMDHAISTLRRAQPNNTALRFQFNTIVQRYTTYNTYWRRITRQIEEGTYKRDVLRARRIVPPERERDERAERPDSYEIDVDLDIDAALDAAMKKSEPPLPPPSGVASGNAGGKKAITPFAHPSDKPPRAVPPGAMRSFPAPPGVRPQGARPAPPPVPRASGARGAPPPVPPGKLPAPPPARAGAGQGGANGMSDAEIRKLHQRYAEARRKNGERADNVKLESIARSVNQLMPKLKEKHAGKQIGFEVVVRNGKVALKPVAK